MRHSVVMIFELLCVSRWCQIDDYADASICINKYILPSRDVQARRQLGGSYGSLQTEVSP